MIGDDERRARLARRHRLLPSARAERIADVAESLVGLHSSDPVTVYLSAAARLVRASVGDVDRALYEDRDVVRHHAMRRTLWVFTPETARLAHASTTLGLVASHRRTLGKLLVENDITDDPDRWLDEAIAATLAALSERGEATTRELGQAVPSLRAPLSYPPDKPYGGTIAAHTRVLTLLGFMGEIVRARPLGTWISGQYRWAAASNWISGGLAGHEPAAAAAAIVDRYLHAFGPASPADVQWWTGWSKRATSLAAELAGARDTITSDGERCWIAADDAEPTREVPPWVALLPALDPTTMGWKERAWYLDDDRTALLFDRNGNGGPTIWVDGRIVGGWAQRADGEIAIRMFAPLSVEHQRLLDAEIERLTSFVGDTRFTLRFPTPLTRELTA